MSVYGSALIGERTFRPFAFTGALGVVQPAAQRVFQRTTRTGGAQNLGQAAIPLSLTPTQPIGVLETQVRDASVPTTILSGWSQANASTLAAGVAAAVTQIIPARLGWTLIDLRANGEFGSIVTTPPIGVGEVVAATGQSLACDFWGTTESGDTATLASLGVVPSAYTSCLAGWDGGANGALALPTPGQAWATPADGGAIPSAFAAELLRLLVAATGVNAGLAGYAWTGQPVAQWAPTGNPGNPNVWTNLVAVLDQTPAFGTLIWCQGHNDARTPAGGVNGQLTPAATYVSALQTILAALAARYPAMSFARLLSAIPAIGAAASAKYPSAWIEVIRGAQQAVIAADPLAQQVDGLDVALSAADQLHPTQAGNITLARHFYRACMKAISPAAFPSGDRGPKLSGTPTRIAGSATITIPVAQNAGTALVSPGGSPQTQFQVFPSGALTGALPIASVSLGVAGQLTITLATAPSDSQALDVWYRLPYDATAAISNGIFDNATDADGLVTGRQLSLSGATAALTVAAPAASSTIFLAQPSGQFAAGQGTIALSGTTTSDTGAVTISVDGSAPTTLVASQTGTFAGAVATPSTGGSHMLTAALADAPTHFSTVTITVEQATLSAVPTSGIQGVILSGATCALVGLSTAYAALRIAGADELPRTAFSGSVVPSLVPKSIGSYALAIYDQATAGALLATAVITVAAPTALPAIGTAVALFDASLAASVFADAARTTPQSGNFGPVQGFADQSGNAFHTQQATASKAPALILNRRLSRPGLKLIGANSQALQNLAGATWMQGLMTGPLTVLAVFEIASDATGSAPYVPVSLAYSGNATGQNSFDVQASTTSTPWVGAARNPPGGFGSAKDTATAVTQKSLLLKVAATFSSAAATLTVVVNGDAAIVKTAIGTPLSQAGSLWDTFFLGGQPGSPAFGFDGYLYEIDIWSVAATTAQLQSLVTYATTKWGS